MHTVRKGDIAVLKVAVALIERGDSVLKPMSENERYDLAVDRGGKLYRVQVKTSRYRNGAVVFNTCSSLAHRGGPRRPYTSNEIEAFGVYCPQLGTVYLVPFERITGHAVQALRVSAAKNKQSKGVLLAADFECGRLAQ